MSSEDGSDLFVERDCEAAGNCNGGGTETHLMVYDAECGASPWFDTTTGQCRNQPSGAIHDGEGSTFASNAGCAVPAPGELKICNDNGVLKLLDSNGVLGAIEYQ